MTTRLDLVLQKHPDQEAGIRLLASRDPSSNLKYLDWAAKMLASGQALAPELADILELFHQFAGQWWGTRHRREQVRSDIYTYYPQDLAKLRELLLKKKRAKDAKRRKRERLYRIEGAVEADVVCEWSDLVVRHIMNKQASVHYGLGTKWCISMLREEYFEDYASQNATFFFFERKRPMKDEFDKVALMVTRNVGDQSTQAFTSTDRSVDMFTLAKVHGTRIFDVFREVYERSERYPGSAMCCVYAGTATEEQLTSVFASIAKGDKSGRSPHETDELLEAICCNDAAPYSLLEEVMRRAPAMSLASGKRFYRRRGRHRQSRRRRKLKSKTVQPLMRMLAASMVVHPQVPADVRERIIKELRLRHINVEEIRRVMSGGRIGISYSSADEARFSQQHYLRRRRHRRSFTVKALRKRAQMYDRAAARMRKSARTLQRKLTAKKKIAAAKKKKQGTKR